MTYPHSDDLMVYDHSKHRYILTETFVLRELNRDLPKILADSGEASDTLKEAKILLDRVSQHIYSFVLSRTDCPNARERKMAKDGYLRRYIMDAMAEQLIYVMTNGDLSAYTGINIDTGATIDPTRMRQAQIAPMAEYALVRCGLANVVISPYEREITPDYDEEGY